MRNRFPLAVALLALSIGLLSQGVRADSIQWTGVTSTDFEVPGNWVGTTTPPTDDMATDTAVFAGVVPANEPLLTVDRSIGGLNFTSAGWNIFNSGPAYTLTVGSRGVDSVGAGTNIVGTSADLALGAAIEGIIWHVGAGNTLQIGSTISGVGGTRLSKSGAGVLSVRNTSPYDAATDLLYGRLDLTDNGALTGTPYIVVRSYTEFVLDNTGTTDLGDRFPDASRVALYGGQFEYKGRAGITSTETVSLRRGPGASELIITPGVGGAAALTIASMLQSTGGSISFVASSGTLGDSGNNPRIFITGQPAGFLGGWATVNGADFASYDLAKGVVALPGARPGQVEGSVATDNVRTLSAQTTLTADTTINSLVVTGAYDSNLGGCKLDVASGGILKTNNTTYSITNGRLTAGGGSPGELFAIIGDNTTTISADIVDNGGGVSLVKSGAGRLDLTGSNTYTGGTYVNSGVLWLGATTYLADGAAVQIDSGASMVLNSAADTIGSLSGLGALDLGACALSVGASNQSTTHSGVVSGAGSLVKIGTGTLNLLGGNTHSGGTTVAGGRLAISGHLNSLGSGALTLNDNTTIQVGNADRTVANPLILNGGPNGINFGLNVSGVKSLTFSGPTTLNGNTTLDVEKKVTVSGSIADGVGGPYSLRKIGSGPVILSGANTHGGGTMLVAGSLCVAHNNALGTGPLTLQPGTNIGATGFQSFTVSNPVSMAGTITFGGSYYGELNFTGDVGLTGDTTVYVQHLQTSVAFLGSITGSSDLTIDESGPRVNSKWTTLGGPNSFTGTFQVKTGALRLSHPDSLADSVTVELLAGATLDMQSDVTVQYLYLNGVQQGGGTYNAGNTPAYFTGSYSLVVLSGGAPPQPEIIPEPVSLGLLGLGLLGFRRRRRS